MSDEKTPYERPGAGGISCPDCGGIMSIVTRASEKPTHSAPLVWSCMPCKKSWSVPVVRVACASVEFDDGTR